MQKLTEDEIQALAHKIRQRARRGMMKDTVVYLDGMKVMNAPLDDDMELLIERYPQLVVGVYGEGVSRKRLREDLDEMTL